MDSELRMMLIKKHEKNGVNFLCTDGVIIEETVTIEPGVTIYPCTILEGNSHIATGAILGPNTLIRNSNIGAQARVNASQVYDSSVGESTTVGPFAHLRPNCHIGEHVKIGAFVEVKNSVIGEKSSLAHLCYAGDADVGEHVNFGCGTVIANYDGKHKYRTIVGDNAFIGCNANLVAPVKIGDGAFVAAGTTVTHEVAADALAIGRVQPTIKEDWAKKYFAKDK